MDHEQVGIHGLGSIERPALRQGIDTCTYWRTDSLRMQSLGANRSPWSHSIAYLVRPGMPPVPAAHCNLSE